MHMAIEVYHHDSLPSTAKSTRESASDASLKSRAARVTTGPHSMQEGSQTASLLGSSVKKRRHSKPKTGRFLARSISTPQLRGPIMSESDADKKRNKLGYQRISIACAHCRRRKIRCLVADGDPQSRCQNCIRLKKECVFYPVDQQSAIENKSQSSKTGGGTEVSSNVSSSPPEIGAGRPFDERHDGREVRTLPSNAPPSYQMRPLEPGSAISSQGSFPGHDYNYSHAPESTWPPQPEFATHGHPVQPEQTHHLNHNFERYDHAVAPGDVAPFYAEGIGPHHDAQAAHHYHYQHRGVNGYWQHQPHPPPPLRSMSYDHAHNMQNNQAYPVGYQPGPSYHHPEVRPVPLSLEMQSPAIMGEPSGPYSAPIGQFHHAYGDHSRSYVLPPEVHAMHHTGAQPSYPVQWYQGPPQFAAVSEDASEPYTNDHDRPG